ncbi:MAG: radical SAM protein [Anaerolineae bacterium]|nr:radical SAM protein [Anaerolineae bacterium]
MHEKFTPHQDASFNNDASLTIEESWLIRLRFARFITEVVKHREAIRIAISPSEKLRYINWYLQHGCDLSCHYCQVPKQRVSVMDRSQRIAALSKLRQLSVKYPTISILGGEPTLRPQLLVEAVHDATEAGFLVNLVSNGWGLTPELITQLGEAGLYFLGISVDCDSKAQKSNLEKALVHHTFTRQAGIIPVINTVITRETDVNEFKKFAKAIIDSGCFISPLACSPAVPHGVFSSASSDAVPTKEQLRQIVPWLARQKLKTGRVTGTFSYLWQLFHSGTTQAGETQLWHCSSKFRAEGSKEGRGFLTLDSDGFIGPCQEFPRLVNLLELPDEHLSLQLLDESFSGTTEKCPGCLYNCYIMEEDLKGAAALLETPTLIRIADIHGERRS